MARSRRKPFWYLHCIGDSMPGQAKKRSSRYLRRRARQLLSSHSFDAFLNGALDDPTDRIRGRAGSRSDDWGWIYFGDGRVGVPDCLPRFLRKWGFLYDRDWVEKQKRK